MYIITPYWRLYYIDRRADDMDIIEQYVIDRRGRKEGHLHLVNLTLCRSNVGIECTSLCCPSKGERHRRVCTHPYLEGYGRCLSSV